jgi:hypothetical protein
MPPKGPVTGFYYKNFAFVINQLHGGSFPVPLTLRLLWGSQAMLPFKFIFAATFVAVLTFCTGCNNQPTHPNQINAFDGASYDSLTVAHAALVSLRSSVSTTQQQYTVPFNEAAQTYTTAYNGYATYRTAQTNEAALVLALSNLTTSITSLESTFQTGMNAAPADIARARQSGLRFRATLGKRITVSDILTELEIAASVASTIPGTQPYSTLAAIVIKMAQDGLAAFSASSGQLIDLSTIQPVALIQ